MWRVKRFAPRFRRRQSNRERRSPTSRRLRAKAERIDAVGAFSAARVLGAERSGNRQRLDGVAEPPDTGELTLEYRHHSTPRRSGRLGPGERPRRTDGRRPASGECPDRCFRERKIEVDGDMSILASASITAIGGRWKRAGRRDFGRASSIPTGRGYHRSEGA